MALVADDDFSLFAKNGLLLSPLFYVGVFIFAGGVVTIIQAIKLRAKDKEPPSLDLRGEKK